VSAVHGKIDVSLTAVPAPTEPAQTEPAPTESAIVPDQLAETLAGLKEAAVGNARAVTLAAARRHLVRIQQHVQAEFERGELSGLQAARRLAALMDGLVAVLFAYAMDQSSEARPDRLAVAATGGYGRGLLAPFSDIDLLFLTQNGPLPETLRAVEFMLYMLWDLGLKVGHATRSVLECLEAAEADITVRTALIDARRLGGEQALFDDLQTRFHAAQRDGVAEFIAAKQAERATRHARYGESPFVVEPNIKEGRGGLRDLQTLYWMSRYVFGTQTMAELVGESSPGGGLLTEGEAKHARRAWDFLWTVRFHLHYVAGRAEERLTFDLQPVVGARMGYTRHARQDGVERFMRHYFLTAREVARVTRVLEPAIVRAALGPPALAAVTDPALHAAGFALADGQLLLAPGRDFHDEPILLLRILQIARDRVLELHPLAVRSLIRNERRAIALRGDPEAAAIFMDLLCGRSADHPRAEGAHGHPRAESAYGHPRAEGAPRHPRVEGGHWPPRADGAHWLGILNETGVLGRYLPDWARIVGQMQFDTYHVFTVDEHTIEAVRVLNTMERHELVEVAPVASGLMDHLYSRRALYVATLLHDIAKGRGGDHSELGAEVALNVGPMLGLTAEETEMVSWLVLHHLLLSQTAFKRDIDDPKTILDIAETIQSPERLRLLLVLTVADMRAVSSKVWNGWKATLLRELYARVAEVLAGGLATTERDARVARAKEAASALLADWPEEQVDRFLSLGYASYWLSFDPETHARHARLMNEAEARHAPLTVDTQPLPARAVTEVTVYTADHAGLFSKIAGALAVAGASIVDARIHTMTNGMALDTFWIQDAGGGAFDAPHRIARLSVLIEQALSGRIRLPAEMGKLSRSLMGRRMRVIHVPPRVVIDNSASNTHTVVEVNGRDRPGLLHDVTTAISGQGLQIASAHVSTYGVRAVDVFYVKDVFGLKVENERKLTQLREALLAALTAPEEAAVAPVVPPRRRQTAATS
jgi:[protein-PII] uridylyltransferase